MLTIAIIENGEVLDSEQISREEFWNMSALGAFALLREIQIGDAP
jgi:hypothetical protein